jgi:hypothetical protein
MVVAAHGLGKQRAKLRARARGEDAVHTPPRTCLPMPSRRGITLDRKHGNDAQPPSSSLRSFVSESTTAVQSLLSSHSTAVTASSSRDSCGRASDTHAHTAHDHG